MNKNAIVISASSDIATAICKDWCSKGWNVFGTYRNLSAELKELKELKNFQLVHCDLLDLASVEKTCETLSKMCPKWDVLLFAPCKVDPIGSFEEVDFDQWEEGIQLNLLRQLRILHKLLPHRNKTSEIPEPSVLFFAGGGTNNAVLNYSSYTLSKIALIKMTELLDAELPDVRFAIIGPGWVKTKVHLTTLQAGAKLAGENFQKTLEKMNRDEFTPMQKIIDCCNWVIHTKSKGVRGRNFSVVFDPWEIPALETELETDPHMYKLRREKNSWQPKEAFIGKDFNGAVQ